MKQMMFGFLMGVGLAVAIGAGWNFLASAGDFNMYDREAQGLAKELQRDLHDRIKADELREEIQRLRTPC